MAHRYLGVYNEGKTKIKVAILKKSQNWAYISIVALVTVALLYGLPLIPGYLKEAKQPELNTLQFQIVFLVASAILIGVPAGLHYVFTPDYSRLKSVWFFVIFGAIFGVILGEGANPAMLIPYAILMLIYALLYKKYDWWQVALTTYIAGILIENVMMRSALQGSTTLWIPFFIYPYFAAKLWENRKSAGAKDMGMFFLKTGIVSAILAVGAYYFTLAKDNVSPPLIFMGITLPFVVALPVKVVHVLKKRGKGRWSPHIDRV